MDDYQKAKVYQWEDTVVGPLDKGSIAFGQIQGMVNAIWSELGLKYPPKVKKLDGRTRAVRIDNVVATGGRGTMEFGRTTHAWIVLHELCHSLTTTIDGETDRHGPIFMGLYVQLLVRYMRMSEEILLKSLTDWGIDIQVDAQPAFLK